MKIIWIVISLCFSQLTYTQQTTVACDQQRPIYLGIDNPLNIFIEGEYCRSINVTVDNGSVEKKGCQYNYHPKRLGYVIFTLYKKQNGKRVKIGTHRLYVLPIPKPIAMVGAYENGSTVAKGGFCVQQGVAAFISGLSFELTFKVLNFSVIILHDSTIVFNAKQTGNVFDEKLLTAFKAMDPGSIVVIADIWAVGPDSKRIKLDPLEYIIE